MEIQKETTVSTDSKSQKNTMTIYGCGGAGINISREFAEAVGYESTPTPVGYAKPKIWYLDTSHSNVNINHDADMTRFSRIEGAKDGSGGLRGENLDPIRREMKDLLMKHRPSDINLVVFSAAGGSGSTIGPVVVKELLTQDHPVVAVVFIDWSNELRTRNSFNTLKTLNNIASSSGKPVIVYPVSNRDRAIANDIALKAMTNISLLFSNEHAELDNADTYNFLNYHRVTSYQPMVSSLEIVSTIGSDTEVKVDTIRPISLAMLHTSSEQLDKMVGAFTTSYSCEGILKSTGFGGNNTGTISYLISTQEINNITEVLDKQLKVYVDNASAEMGSTSVKFESKHMNQVQNDGDFVL